MAVLLLIVGLTVAFPWLGVVVAWWPAVVGSWLVVSGVVALWLVVEGLAVLSVAVGVTVKDGSRVADFL